MCYLVLKTISQSTDGPDITREDLHATSTLKYVVKVLNTGMFIPLTHKQYFMQGMYSTFET